jgi:hypothetical protein
MGKPGRTAFLLATLLCRADSSEGYGDLNRYLLIPNRLITPIVVNHHRPIGPGFVNSAGNPGNSIAMPKQTVQF